MIKRINKYHVGNMDMECPYCNSKMQPGVIQSSRWIYFTSKPNRWFSRVKSEDTCLSTNNAVIPTCVAYHCPKCKKVIVDYDKVFDFES